MRRIPHQIYYFFELLVLLAGFYVITLFSAKIYLQTVTLALVLIFYTALGILHHEIHHALNRKIVVEYILIAALIFACFVFINIGRI